MGSGGPLAGESKMPNRCIHFLRRTHTQPKPDGFPLKKVAPWMSPWAYQISCVAYLTDFELIGPPRPNKENPTP